MNAVTPNQIMQQNRREPVSQATTVEQSRAVAEVQAAVIVAQNRPRNEAQAMAKAMESCRQWPVAEGAFYKFPRGGETVAGETISLAVELARCWGNVQYGVMELARNDDAHESEMLAFAWDLETNTQSRQTFLVPHKRDTRQGPKVLTDMRDIYENNTNNAARRLRECIFRILPPYLKEAAKQTCLETLERGQGEKPLQVRIAEAINSFKAIGVSQDRLEAKLGGSANWTAVDVANLQVSYRSVKRNEVSADEEFPRVGASETAEAGKRLVDRAKAKVEPKPELEAEVEQGRSDEQMGDQHSGAEPEREEGAGDDGELPPWTDAAQDVRDTALGARSMDDIKDAARKLDNIRVTLPEKVEKELDQLITDGRAAYQKKDA
ncbi:MAG: hypothetical protein ACT6Q7_02685 [Blastomonas fulva]|uniref:hypothetical protein n=1 Tax=Blastomonas fulva TaxID=1550728 RepID=UPI0040334E86